MQHDTLEGIVDKFGDRGCRECFEEYERLFQRSMRKLQGPVMGGYDINRRECHYLSKEFSTMLHIVGNKLNECANVEELKEFLYLYSHPEKRYIEPCVYLDDTHVAICDSTFLYTFMACLVSFRSMLIYNLHSKCTIVRSRCALV